MRGVGLLALLCALGVALGGATDEAGGGRLAFATVFHDEFPLSYKHELAVRVFAQSARNVRSAASVVAMVEDTQLTTAARRRLARDGVHVHVFSRREAEAAASPARLSRFSGREAAAYAHLAMRAMLWRLPGFDRVMAVEPLQLLVHNPDWAFRCSPFCVMAPPQVIYDVSLFVCQPGHRQSLQLYRDALRDVRPTTVLRSFLPLLHMAASHAPQFPFLNASAPPPPLPPLADGAFVRRLPSLLMLNHVFYYEKMTFSIIRCGPHCNSKVPVTALAFRMGFSLFGVEWGPPWHWWSFLFFNLGHLWLDARRQLPDSPQYAHVASAVAAVAALCAAIDWAARRPLLVPTLRSRCAHAWTNGAASWLQWLPVVPSLCVGAAVLTWCLQLHLLPPTMYPVPAFCACTALSGTLLYFLGRAVDQPAQSAYRRVNDTYRRWHGKHALLCLAVGAVRTGSYAVVMELRESPFFVKMAVVVPIFVGFMLAEGFVLLWCVHRQGGPDKRDMNSE